MQKIFKPSEKYVSMPRIDEKKLHTWKFQLNGSSRNMRCKLLQKRVTGKTTECSKHLHHIAIERNILSELSRCIFQIPLKYIKLVIPKILFILVLCSFNFYFRIKWPPPTKLQNPVQQDYLPESYARHLPSYQKYHKTVAPTRCGLFPLPLNLYG